MHKLKTKTIVAIVFLVALALRLLAFKTGEVFISSDETRVAAAAMDLFYIFSNFSFQNALNHVFTLLAYAWGYVAILITALNIALLNALRIQLTEATLSMPMAIIGALSAVVIFFIGKEIHSEETGIIAALLLAIMPVHLQSSRSLGTPGLVSSFFLLLAVYFFLRFFKTGSKKLGVIASIFSGFYLSNSNQFAGLLPLVFFIGFFAEKKGNWTERAKSVLGKVFKKEVLLLAILIFLPLLISFAYFAVHGRLSEGMIGHTFFGRAKSIGFYPIVFQSIAMSAGVMLSVLFVPAIINGLKKAMRFKVEGFLFFWAIIYLAPWFFLVKPAEFVDRNLLIEALAPLVLLSAITLSETKRIANGKPLFFLLAMVIILGTFLTSLSAVYKINLFGLNETVYYGSVKENIGSKTAGYYLRQNSSENATVFTELGTLSARYYFHRKVLAKQEFFWSIASAPIEKKLEYFDSLQEKPVYVVLLHSSLGVAEKYLGEEYYDVVDIYSNGKPVMHIFSKEKKKKIGMNTEEFDGLFDKKYGNLESLAFEKYFEN